MVVERYKDAAWGIENKSASSSTCSHHSQGQLSLLRAVCDEWLQEDSEYDHPLTFGAVDPAPRRARIIHCSAALGVYASAPDTPDTPIPPTSPGSHPLTQAARQGTRSTAPMSCTVSETQAWRTRRAMYTRAGTLSPGRMGRRIAVLSIGSGLSIGAGGALERREDAKPMDKAGRRTAERVEEDKRKRRARVGRRAGGRRGRSTPGAAASYAQPTARHLAHLHPARLSPPIRMAFPFVAFDRASSGTQSTAPTRCSTASLVSSRSATRHGRRGGEHIRRRARGYEHGRRRRAAQNEHVHVRDPSFLLGLARNRRVREAQDHRVALQLGLRLRRERTGVNVEDDAGVASDRGNYWAEAGGRTVERVEEKDQCERSAGPGGVGSKGGRRHRGGRGPARAECGGVRRRGGLGMAVKGVGGARMDAEHLRYPSRSQATAQMERGVIAAPRRTRTVSLDLDLSPLSITLIFHGARCDRRCGKAEKRDVAHEFVKSTTYNTLEPLGAGPCYAAAGASGCKCGDRPRTEISAGMGVGRMIEESSRVRVDSNVADEPH
ncbi:hypothetical protein DFH06DRAFT_1369639 [Mycena polygramma]|nr:hypothetical protein DFH06DRAFT_1369639 [Mycena polygramma]